MKQEKWKDTQNDEEIASMLYVIIEYTHNNLNKTETDNNLKATRRSRFLIN